MSNMQVFQKRLSASADANKAYQRHLVRLTQASRDQVLNITDELTWFIWDAEKTASA